MLPNLEMLRLAQLLPHAWRSHCPISVANVIGEGSILSFDLCHDRGAVLIPRHATRHDLAARRLQRGCSMAKGVIDPFQSKCGSVFL